MEEIGHYVFESAVERLALEKSQMEPIYPPTEKIPVIIVDNFPELGKLTAMRFIEWVQKNPDGVISLPTGKTPEHFIKWVQYFLKNWNLSEAQADLKSWGIDTSIKPQMDRLRFVQIDEFYPINPIQNNSFYHYINRFYIKGFGLDRDKALLIDAYRIGIPRDKETENVFKDDKVDLSLRTRQATNTLERIQKKVIEEVDQYCYEYETKIRNMGGIGFFLGGIGPDGHIGFNVKGSDHYSTTRLTPTNYETQAAAASDMGGIEVARNRLVITIGLKTIVNNSDAVAIIIASGESKSKIVANAIQNEENNLYPATVLHNLKKARFFITKGAARHLVERRYQELYRKETLTDEQCQRVVINLSIFNQKPIRELSRKDFTENKLGNLILTKSQKTLSALKEEAEQSLQEKIRDGVTQVEGEIFMHTAPHHDDIMLGFWPYMVHLVRDPKNKHVFNYMTSGFTAVTNKYVLDLLETLEKHIDSPTFKKLLQENYF
ncbi:MAG: glucosamine-6-phosphate deaminase, partial [bacterium]|nr:glucosamine-6-phosphate deaminase [bacterium]